MVAGAVQAYSNVITAPATVGRAARIAALTPPALVSVRRASTSAIGSTELLRATIAALDAQSQSLQRTDAVASTAGGTLEDVSSLLHEASALAIASTNIGGLSDGELAANQLQIDSVITSVDRLLSTSSFSGLKLFDGELQFTAGGESLAIPAVSANTLGQVEVSGESRVLSDVRFGAAADLLNDPAAASDIVHQALSDVSTLRGQIGAFQKDLIHPQILSGFEQRAAATNAQASHSDADFALESASHLRQSLISGTSASFSTLTAATVLPLLDPAHTAA